MSVTAVLSREGEGVTEVRGEVEGGLGGLVTTLRKVQGEINAFLTQEIVKQGGSKVAEEEEEEEEDEDEEVKEGPEAKVAKLQ